MAMKPLKTAHDMFYFVEDVMQISVSYTHLTLPTKA